MLGFDAREMWVNSSMMWDDARRNKFLYRPDVVKPLSVDIAVWPSVFEYYTGLKPPYVGFYQDLWEELEHLRHCLMASKDLQGRRYWLIAISVVTEDISTNHMQAWESLLAGTIPGDATVQPSKVPATKPSDVGVEWLFLGYDVADQWSTSALSNCGFLPDEDVYGMRKMWSSRLNDFHLFDSLVEAREFQAFANRQASEHAPFFIYSLYGEKLGKGKGD